MDNFMKLVLVVVLLPVLVLVTGCIGNVSEPDISPEDLDVSYEVTEEITSEDKLMVDVEVRIEGPEEYYNIDVFDPEDERVGTATISSDEMSPDGTTVNPRMNEPVSGEYTLFIEAGKTEEIEVFKETFSYSPEKDVQDKDDEEKEIDFEDGSKGIFYEVHGGENEVYLFGSLHFGTEDMYPFHGKVNHTLHDSDVLGLELDLTEVSEFEMMEEVMLEERNQVTDIISQETFNKTVEIIDDPLLDRTTLKHFKPWYLASLVQIYIIERAGYSPELGVEIKLMEKVSDEDIEIVGIEDMEDQMQPFYELSDESQEIYLEHTIETVDENKEVLDQMASDWKEGNIEGIARYRNITQNVSTNGSLDGFEEAILDERNEQMAAEIEGFLDSEEEKTYFISVGSLHLVGEGSIPENLEDKGYQVENMYE